MTADTASRARNAYRASWFATSVCVILFAPLSGKF
jgi:hypothetical protein